MKIYRHGDVLIRQIKELPENLKKYNSKIVAEGEATGHNHELVGNNCQVLVDEKQLKFILVEEPTKIKHPEHKEIELDPGNYEVVIEKEYDYFLEEVKKVQD